MQRLWRVEGQGLRSHFGLQRAGFTVSLVGSACSGACKQKEQKEAMLVRPEMLH